MKLVVHVGPGKTGSTAIQSSLQKARARLADDGVVYLGHMMEHAPRRRYEWQRPGGFDAFSRLPAQRGKQEFESVLVDCIAGARAAGMHTCVMSNESWLRRGSLVRQVIEGIKAHESMDVVVVAYARNHARLVSSGYVQWGLLHKTYKGRIRDFREWTAGRDLALHPSIAEWASAFGAGFRLRNYDAAPDVVSDFMRAAGLDAVEVEPVRAYETPSANEIALRALFNDMHEEAVPPSRFSRLFDTARLDFKRPIGRWLGELFPDQSALDELCEALSDDRERINSILRSSGQPEIGNSRSDGSGPGAPEPDALVSTLFQMIVTLARKVESLEQVVDGLARPPEATSGQLAIMARCSRGWPVGMPASDVRDALAPGLGYFGAHATDCLEVAVDSQLSGLRISLHEATPVFLNLRGLELVKAGKAVRLDAEGVKARQSSVAGDDHERNGAELLLAMRGIHSKAETDPWWQAEFDPPLDCDGVRIWNRSDGWGSRSRTLRLEAIGAGGGGRLLHDCHSPESLCRVLGKLTEASGGEALGEWPEAPDEARQWRETQIEVVAQRIRSGDLPLADVPWRLLMQVVDVWGREDDPSEATWTVLAAFLLHQAQGRHGTSIKAMSLLLSSRERLLHLQDKINEVAAALELGRFMLTRHGVKSEGVLRKDPARFVAHMRAVISALESMGREPFLAYGTLLGAVRDQDFIAHDDDIDLMCRSTARSRKEAEQDVLVLKEGLRELGFKVVDLLPNSLNLHVIDKKNGAVMDVFPCWLQDDALCMHMESMKVRGIPEAFVYPRSMLSFHGQEFPAPSQPEAFLQARYGEGWRVSDQFYEWPWSLVQ